MKKCEWKDGEFDACSLMKKDYRSCTYSKETPEEVGVSIKWYESGVIYFCPFCGADIRKPEPQVIIKKSGETWVYRANGKDYFVYNPSEAKSPHCLMTLINNCGADNVPCAKPISEIEITDEIAKLRPIIIGNTFGKQILYGVQNEFAIHGDGCVNMSKYSCDLATVEDL